MSCREFEELVALQVEGDLPVRKAELLQAHLAACDCCRQYAAEMGESQSILKRLRDDEVEPTAFDQVRSGVLAQLLQTGARPARFWWRYALAGSCAVLILLAVVWQKPAPAPAPPSPPVAAVRPAPMPVTTRSPVVRVKRHQRRVRRRPEPRLTIAAAPSNPSDPLLIKVRSTDPNVVIYWIMDKKGESQ